MRIYLVTLLLFFFDTGNGQNTETDSLKKLLVSKPEGPGRVVVLEGLSYAYLSSYPDSSLQYALAGLELAKKIKDRKGEALCTNALGNVYFHAGDYPKSLELYFETLAIEQKFNNRNKVPSTYFNIASVYTEEEDYQNALFYISKAKEEDERLKDSSGILFDFYSLGSIYLRMGKTDSALIYIQQSYEMAQVQNDMNMIGAILNTFGEAYTSLKETRRAAAYYHFSIPYVKAINDNEVLAANYFGLAKGFSNENMPDSSIYYARLAIQVASSSAYLKQIMESSAFLTAVFKNKKQFDSAFKYQEMSISARDSLFNVDKIRKVQNLKFQEQQRLQTIETARAAFRSKVKLYVVIGSSLIFLVFALLSWRNSKQKQKANILLQQQKAKAEQAFRDLKSTQALLVQSEKMASLGELTAGIAHELQNPLNFVNNFSEVNKELLEELKTEAKTASHKEILALAGDLAENEERIHHHGQRAAAIIKGMLEHSRNNTGQKELTDINVLADEYLRLSFNGYRAKIKDFHATLKTDFGGSIGRISIIPQDIGRVLLNLYNNAFYAVTEKARLLTSPGRDLPANGEDYEPIVSVNTKKSGNKIEISVTDNGTGISPDIIDKIFQPFFTTKPTGEGTGLGLSLSYDIVKSFGGEIKAESKPGEFSRFTVLLPSQILV